MQRLTEPRIAPLLLDQWDAELRARFERPGGLDGIFNVMKTLANYPQLFRRWLVFANHFLFKSTLTTRDREILILRTGWLAGCAYEWGQHLKIAADQAGFGEAEFDALAQGASATLWNASEAALIQAADGIYINALVDDTTWDTLSASHDERQLLDIVFIVSNYLLLAMGINSFGVQLDAGLNGFSAVLALNDQHPTEALPTMGVRHATPRLAPLLDAECTPSQLEILRKARGHLSSVNVLDTLIRHADLLRRWMPFFVHVLHKSSLPARDREILILRTGRLCGAEYEWAQHVPFAARAGLSADEIRCIAEGANAAIWTEPHEQTLLRAADQLHRHTMLDDATWAALAERYDQCQLMDTVFTVGQYRLVSAGLNTLCVQLDAYLEPYDA
ncbi:MAG: carboxymuconolactone decarboxylase family protein [bacterium]|nr:carboxymuconolactone decarboxylase family protein [bacterium]